MKEPNIYNTLIPDIFNLQKTILKKSMTYFKIVLSVLLA
jgi:hypothetical protein